jgi:hypothetical protein
MHPSNINVIIVEELRAEHKHRVVCSGDDSCCELLGYDTLPSDTYQRFGETCCLYFKVVSYTEYGGNMLLSKRRRPPVRPYGIIAYKITT